MSEMIISGYSEGQITEGRGQTSGHTAPMQWAVTARRRERLKTRLVWTLIWRETSVTEERVADVLGDLVSRLARLGEVQQLATQHPLELWYTQTTAQIIFILKNSYHVLYPYLPENQ